MPRQAPACPRPVPLLKCSLPSSYAPYDIRKGGVAASLETKLSHVMHNSSALFIVVIVVAVCILASFVKIFHFKSFVLPLPSPRLPIFACCFLLFAFCLRFRLRFSLCFCCCFGFGSICLCKFNGMQCVIGVLYSAI